MSDVTNDDLLRLNLSKAKAIKALEDLCDSDQEMAHGAADEILLKFLRDNGHTDLADAFDNLAEDVGGFWYA